MPGFEPYDPGASGSDGPVSAVIRPATPADVDDLSTIELAVVTRTPERWAELVDEGQRLDEKLLLVAEVDGSIAAFAQSVRFDEHATDLGPAGYFLCGVTVRPNFRRRGLAHRLTTARLDWIRERANEAWYFANVGNLTSIELHHEFGFVEVDRAPIIHGVDFSGSGEGILFRAGLQG